MSQHEVLVIGSGMKTSTSLRASLSIIRTNDSAGLSGLAFARFYLEIHPKAKLTILEASSCLGGVWSSSRSYHQFWCQSGRRMSGFSDVPLTVPANAPIYHDIFESKYVTRYLEEYVDSHAYDGLSLRSRILFSHRVRRVEKLLGMWELHVELSGKSPQVFKSPKLIVATGRNSVPNMPSLPKQNDFEGHLVHHRDFGKASASTLAESGCRNITVLGGGKSAADMVYQSVKEGKNVNWIIRRNGEGPALFFPAAGHGRYKNSIESAATRFKACFSPSSFMPNLWLPRLFHRSSYGTKYMSELCSRTDEHCRELAQYQTRKGALPSFRDLEATASAFWVTGPLGLVQHDDFWDTIAQNVHVYRKDIAFMIRKAIVLDDGEEVPTDALLCGTGWNSTYPFFSLEMTQTLGLSFQGEETDAWTSLLEAADRKVVASFPLLEHLPPHRKPETRSTTAKLYKGVAPLDDNSIAFLGHINVSNAFRTAEAQAIWTTAYMDGKITLPSPGQAQKEVAYMSAFSRRRYPSQGQKGDCLFFELVWYTDALLGELGLSSHRKGLWADWVEPCLAGDFNRIPDEYRAKYGS